MSKESKKWVEKDPEEDVWWPTEAMKEKAWVSDESIYEEAREDPIAFWEELAEEGLDWVEKWDEAYEWDSPFIKWFLNGKINASYNCLDRHIKAGNGDKNALIWVPEPEDEETVKWTYNDLYERVQKFANVLKSLGVEKGDRVGIYLPLVPEAHVAMLACARIGAPHSVVFSAFSPDSLNVRLNDAEAKVLITADGYYRRGKEINLKKDADKGLKDSPVDNVVVVRRTESNVNMEEGRDHYWNELMKDAEADCDPEVMDSEDMLFLLYTSGTTGKPKGVIHTTGGYLTQAYWTTKWVFNLHDDDLHWCTADIGWITGHTYTCYGPYLNNATSLIYEGAPNYPEPDRMWEIAEEHGVTIFYTAPTLIRALKKAGDEWVDKHDLSSLRILGTVGEPIDKEAWIWYLNKVGEGRCPIVDTWWQTETGGTLIMSLPGIGPFIPTVAGRSFPGMKHKILDRNGDLVEKGEEGALVQAGPFAPGMLRGVYKNPERYKETYWSRYDNKYYFTSDAARRTKYDCIRIGGRMDDVMQVAGHRLSTAEVEDAINRHEAVLESAVVPEPHDVKGEVPVGYVILRKGEEPSEDLEKEIIGHVSEALGPTSKPAEIIFVEELPKTRSGKIMRRILRSLLTDDELGDITTLKNPESVDRLKEITEYEGPD